MRRGDLLDLPRLALAFSVTVLYSNYSTDVEAINHSFDLFFTTEPLIRKKVRQ